MVGKIWAFQASFETAAWVQLNGRPWNSAKRWRAHFTDDATYAPEHQALGVIAGRLR